MATLLYQSSKDKVFLYYALYNFILLLYLLTQLPYELGVSIFANSRWLPMNWYIQVIYLSIYFWFGLSFIDFPKHFPKKYRIINTGIITMLILGTLTVIYAVLADAPMFYENYFVYVHVPIYLFMAIYSIHFALKLSSPAKNFFMVGVLVYIIFSLIALTLSIYDQERRVKNPINYFYIGIFIESLVFTWGLGYRIKDMYTTKLQTEENLHEVQDELQNQLKIIIEKQEQEKELLYQQNENQRLVSQQLELKSQVNHLKMSALKSQMNSHFIFNVLNSIKSYIVENESKSAILFLNKFAKMIRIFLESSEKEVLSLYEELENAKLYVNLEKMRFGHEIELEITHSAKIPLRKIQIPSLLLLPFLENAIWKGLMQQEGRKIIQISIDETTDNHYSLLLSDNGERTHNAVDSNSFFSGYELVQERIENFNLQYNTQVSCSIQDTAGGRRVQLTLPLISELNGLAEI